MTFFFCFFAGILHFCRMNAASRPIFLHWMRRDLRTDDNRALFEAWTEARKRQGILFTVFCFDPEILNPLPPSDRRVGFIVDALWTVASTGLPLFCFYGRPIDIFEGLSEQLSISGIYANEDYEPYARSRDASVKDLLKQKGIPFHLFTDHVIFRPDKIVKNDGLPYHVFTPYSRRWKDRFFETIIRPVEAPKFSDSPALAPDEGIWQKLLELRRRIASKNGLTLKDYNPAFPFEKGLLTASQIGFEPEPHGLLLAPEALTVPERIIENYSRTRDLPALADGTTRLGPHLRFGTISIRRLAVVARNHPVFLNELIWREFFQMILYYYPAVDQEFREEFRKLRNRWRNPDQSDEARKDFEAWKAGRTGYPLVDAGMRELAKTGYMHNRVRMVTASFLCKHLLIDWRAGERYFAGQLLDFELASNNGNWQWAAGTGCDAAPYFRIFNPELQQKRFDPQLQYVRRWLPEFGTDRYPTPVIEHRAARARALAFYHQAAG
jgi:deoxyribodipyrimidine photo-lyase